MTSPPPRLLIFSPGFGGSRYLYNAFLSSLSSTASYLIISIDHPHDANFLEYPNSTHLTPVLGSTNDTLPNGTVSTPFLTVATSARVTDIRFTLDSVPKLLRQAGWSTACASAIDTSHVALFGHSLGGAASLSILATGDTRFVAGINFDGLFVPIDNNGTAYPSTRKPFLLVARSGHDFTNDETWNATWPLLKGVKDFRTVDGTTHLSYTDGPVFADVLGLREFRKEEEAVDRKLGTISGVEDLKTMMALVDGFFDQVF